MKFTKTEIDKAIAASGKIEQLFFSDTKPGFGVRVQKGRGRWCIQYQIGGKQRRMSLGKCSKISLENALIKADQAFGQVASDVDPTVVRAKAQVAASGRFGDAIEDFLVYQEGRTKPTYHKATTATLRNWLKCWHNLPINALDRPTVSAKVKSFAADRGATTADRTTAALSKFFNWAIQSGLVPEGVNPASRAVKYVSKKKRGSAGARAALADDKLRKIWHACEADRYGDIVKLLILTGQRRTEIGSLERDEIDLKQAQILLPGERTKNHRDHVIPLSKPALAIVQAALARTNSKHVFGAGGDSENGFLAWSKNDKALRARADVGKWTLHWLRHTLKTWMQSQGIPKDIRNAVQNHIDGDMDTLYGHHTYLKEKRDVLDRWAKHVVEVVGSAKLKLAA